MTEQRCPTSRPTFRPTATPFAPTATASARCYGPARSRSGYGSKRSPTRSTSQADPYSTWVAAEATSIRSCSPAISGPAITSASKRCRNWPNPALHRTGQTIIQADIVREPVRLFVGAEVVYASGTLNTLPDDVVRPLLTHLLNAAGRVLAFNFLSTGERAGADHLFARTPETMQAWLNAPPSCKTRLLTGYLSGDATLIIEKP
ncbi:MAG: hypothetical protein QM770_10960 [Tepidisphaeraceae bacterium]